MFAIASAALLIAAGSTRLGDRRRLASDDVDGNGKPLFFPSTIPNPMAYYFMNEGEGWNLADTVSGDASAGTIVYAEEHQLDPSSATPIEGSTSIDFTQSASGHTGPNWSSDEYFGKSIECGLIDETIIQKDTLSLKDVDYGSAGSWSWSVWYRHEIKENPDNLGNFPNFKREQFFGHGDPLFPTTSRNQIHVQMEKSGVLRTILYDQGDYDRYSFPCMAEHCNLNNLTENPHCYRTFNNGSFNEAAYQCWRAHATGASTDTDRYIRDYDNGMWHHLVLSTRPDGKKGFNMFIDGVLRAASPFVEGIGEDKGYGLGGRNENVNSNGVGGEAIDPEGPIRLCGRAKPAIWVDTEASFHEAEWAPDRYFRGKVAHFAAWNIALSHEQVGALHKAYVDTYNLPVTPFEMPAHIKPPIAYYYMDEGYGFDLLESVSQNHKAGAVRWVADHQIHNGTNFPNYTQPNWMHDDNFGRTISCGKIHEPNNKDAGEQKDIINLADVDYGHNGQWAMSVWYKHVEGANFEGYQREQFFGHGDPLFPTSSRNQVHVQFEKDDGILAIVHDGSDYDRFHLDCMEPFCGDDDFIRNNPECFKWWPNQTENPAAWACYRSMKKTPSFETEPLGFTDNHLWHHMLMTTKGDGRKGMNLYIDGKLEAAAPRPCSSTDPTDCIGIDRCSGRCAGNPPGTVGGDPIDPVGQMRLCGRQLGGAVWNAAYNIHPDDAQYNPDRYFHGKVAHFALWDDALDAHQVQALLNEYRKQYQLPSYSEPPPEPQPLTEEEWQPYAEQAKWRKPCPPKDSAVSRMRRLKEANAALSQDEASNILETEWHYNDDDDGEL